MSKAQHELPILVTGAAGRIGSVGRSVTELLLARGFRVRAQVRVDDERAATLRALGAEVVVGDLLDLMAVHRAIEGCERLCFAMSVAPTYLEAAVNVAVVAKHHGVKAFVNLSQMTVNEMDIFNTTLAHSKSSIGWRSRYYPGPGCQWWRYDQRPSWKGYCFKPRKPSPCRTRSWRLLEGARTQPSLQPMSLG